MAGAIEQTVILNSSIGDNRTSVGENLVILSTFTFPFIISGCGLAGGGSVPQTETPLPISTSSPTTVPTEEPQLKLLVIGFSH
ncbi:MAG: hypothetical protein NTV98_03375 [Candidatus Roizmanbacteria bacterium]|nr:hypothetical protein [Candidatus Roizmanbacteria bacterium]